MAVEQLTQALTRPEPVRPVDEEPLSQFPSVEELARKLGLNVKTVTESFECEFRTNLGSRSGDTWAAIPEHLGSDSGAPGQRFRSTWAAIPEHLGKRSLTA